MVTRNRILMFWTLTAIVVLIAAVRGLDLSGVERSAIGRQQRAAFAAGGLRAAAAVKGSYITTVDTNVGSPTSFEQLTAFSDLIFVGTPLKAVSRLTDDGRSASLFDDVRVDALLKGFLSPNGHVTVILPGGRISFADGSWALVKTLGFRKPANGVSHLWFVRAAKERQTAGFEKDIAPGGAFVPSYGPMGIYCLDGGVVKPSALYGNAFLRELVTSRMDPLGLVDQIRRISTKR
jgi:hypothetical protein